MASHLKGSLKDAVEGGVSMRSGDDDYLSGFSQVPTGVQELDFSALAILITSSFKFRSLVYWSKAR